MYQSLDARLEILLKNGPTPGDGGYRGPSTVGWRQPIQHQTDRLSLLRSRKINASQNVELGARESMPFVPCANPAAHRCVISPLPGENNQELQSLLRYVGTFELWALGLSQ